MDQKILDEPGLLMYVEGLIAASREKEETEENLLSLMGDIATVCIQQGQLSCMKEIDKYSDATEGIAEGFMRGQKLWEFVTTYTRDTLELEFHPLVYATIVSNIDGSNDHSEKLKKAVSIFLSKLQEDIDGAVKEVKIVSVPDIENFSGDPKELIKAYFVMLQQLGTFHNDRDVYGTEDERKLHDKLVAIYNKVGKLPYGRICGA